MKVVVSIDIYLPHCVSPHLTLV